MDRPSIFKPEIVTEICARLATGEPLTAICRDAHTPAWQTVYGWMAKHPEVAKDIARAREVGHDAIAEECLQIANTPVMGEETEVSDAGVKIKRSDALGHRKLQIHTRLQLLAKWNPKKYGDRQAVELTGAEGGPVEISKSEAESRLLGIFSAAEERVKKQGLDLV